MWGLGTARTEHRLFPAHCFCLQICLPKLLASPTRIALSPLSLLLPPVPRDRPQPRAESSPGHEALLEVGAARNGGDRSGEISPRLTCPSSYCFVSQPFLKFSRSGCKEGERRSEPRAGPPAAASSRGPGSGGSLIKHSTAPRETSHSEIGSLRCVEAKRLLRGGAGICCVVYSGWALPSTCDFVLLHQDSKEGEARG